MKKSLFFLMILCTINSNAQNYLISFAGTGASATLSSVKVENLTAGTSLTLSGGNVLRLNILTGIDPVKNILPSQLKIYPNPTTGNSVLQIYPPVKGNADIKVFDMTGREVAQMRSYLENSLQEFRLSGFRKGFYMISVKSDSYSLSGKLISNGKPSGQISIGKISSNPAAGEKASKNVVNKGVQDYIDMPYSVGDRIKFTGISGNYSTVKTDIPANDKTITFNFIACTDGDNNNYPVVAIGTQVWMAENLRTTKYRNGNLIGTTTPATLDISGETAPEYQWSYGGNESNATIYGRLYTWYTITDSRNVCPSDWHAPSHEEWQTLITSAGGAIVAGGKLKETGLIHWLSPNAGATNESGFTSLPGGNRNGVGTFVNLGSFGRWWETDEGFPGTADGRGMYYDNSSADFGFGSKMVGFSLRCLKN